MMQPLTKRQRGILDYLARFIQSHGYAPSLEEICDAFDLSSLATVHKHVENLRVKGYIRRQWNRSRSMELIVGPGCCPTCGRDWDQGKAKTDADLAMKTTSEGVDLKAVGEGSPVPTPT